MDLYGLVVFSGDPARPSEPEAASRLSFEANYLGPMMLAREAADRMKSAGTPGAIVLISTMQAVSIFPDQRPMPRRKRLCCMQVSYLRKNAGASRIFG